MLPPAPLGPDWSCDWASTCVSVCIDVEGEDDVVFVIMSARADSAFPVAPALGRREWERKVGGEEDGGPLWRDGPDGDDLAATNSGFAAVCVGVDARDLGDEGVEGPTEGDGEAYDWRGCMLRRGWSVGDAVEDLHER